MNPTPGLYDPRTEHDACGIGFCAHIKGEKSRAILEDALEILTRLDHRGATGADPDTGDGAGLLAQLPHRFFKRVGLELGFPMPRRRRYAVGQLFLPADAEARAAVEAIVEQIVAEEGQVLLGWRDVPVDPSVLGPTARASMPAIRQVFVGRQRVVPTAFNRKLFVIRKRIEDRVRRLEDPRCAHFHVCSLSAETVVYKGLFKPDQLGPFYADLAAPDFVTAVAVVHSRFSTNTLPTWERAQPFRYIAHNGEINTLRGNVNWMRARTSVLQSAKFDGPLQRLGEIIEQRQSDSAQFDNMLELLHLGGRSLPHAMMLMIPEAHERDHRISAERHAFYEYAATLLEPWDGPAAIVFSDGLRVGATLDRNGLRPARYVVTADDRIILASETGVLDLPPDRIVAKGRLRPGRMLIVDTEDGLILDDAAVKNEIVARFPYSRWLKRNEFHFSTLPEAPPPDPITGDALRRLQRAFGWTDEDVDVIVRPMAEKGKEPTGSMGNDTPLAVLSDHAPSLFSYVKQLFAQVTNPPIDPIREELVMSLRTFIGGGGNSFEETPESCHRITIDAPLITNAELAKLEAFYEGAFETKVLAAVYDPAEGPDALSDAVEALCEQARAAVDRGYNVIVLSDRDVDARWVPIPALLAVSAVHQMLVREGIRLLTGLVVETAEVREVHHLAALIGFGAGSVNPWLLLDTARDLAARGEVPGTPEQAEARVVAAFQDGLRKVMSKMGISTISSYAGAQIFEIVGLDQDLVERHFTGSPSRIRGVGLRELDAEARIRHRRGFGADARLDPDPLPVGGRYAWRRRGELHKWNPATIAYLQKAVREDDAAAWAEYSRLAADETDGLSTLRGMLELVPGEPVPLDEVEPWTSIVTRFATGAMSFGSISAPAHEALAIAMNRIGGRSNSGEGGEEAERWVRTPDGDLRRSAIKQVASARFGVHAAYLVNADELQIKIAQGAKPGEGGQLPGHKVDERIARVRHSTPGVTLISPPPHHDIYSIEDLKQLIYDLKVVNPAARVSVKLVSEVGVGTVAAGVAKAKAGCVVIAGDAGGTGASPLSSIQHTGLPWELGLAETQQVLLQTGLRDRIRVQVDGGLRTGRDVIVGALLGAEEFGFATAALVALGCILLRKCHLNTCSVGVATQDPDLVAKFTGDPAHVIRLFRFIAEDVRRHLAALGFRTLDEAVGRVDRLRARRDIEHWKAARLDLSAILHDAAAPGLPRRAVTGPTYALDEHVDVELIDAAAAALDGGAPVRLERPIRNTDRAVGAMLSGRIAARHGAAGLPEDRITVAFEGSAGQSFGAFLARGVTFHLRGDANDTVAKGLSGGVISVAPPAGTRFAPEENVLVGNTVLYGATAGELYVNGVAGERFAVRNSGARAVVEGVGDHGCEYMTGGVVVVLGPTGRNFAAGMSGGVAFVLDRDRGLRQLVNPGMVELEAVVEESDLWLLYGLIERHVALTGSPLGQRVLDNWEVLVPSFVKVIPTEYKRVLQQRRARGLRRGAAAEVAHG